MAWTNGIVTAPTSDLEERMRCGIRMTIESLASRYASAASDGNVEAAVLGDAQRRLALQLGNYPIPTVPLAKLNTVALLASAAQVATVSSADQVNTGAGSIARGVVVVLNVTVISASTLTLVVQRKNLDGSYTAIATAAAALGALGKQVIVIDPLIGTQTPAADFDAVLDGILPQTWRAQVQFTTGASATFSVDAYPIR